jgi:glutamate dehydrogenase
MTQRGRIEAALAGVRLNTDAIDNSAGVNTSDLEVNLKIALSLPVREGRLTIEQRNALLVEMTDEVAALVLRNNYLQTLALSLSERRGLEDIGFQQRLMQTLESRGELDRAVEFLPDDMEIGERIRRSQPLTRPELSVLLAYAKLSLYSELLDTSVPDDPYLGRELARYFPKVIAEKFPEALEKHRLRREIIATQLANSMINRGGPSLVARVTDETGADSPSIAKAFAAVRDSYGLRDLNGLIDTLDNRIDGAFQLSLYAAVQDLHLDRINWFLRNVDLSRGLADLVEHYRLGIEKVGAALDEALPAEQQAARSARAAELIAASVPEALAKRLASLPELTAAPDIVQVTDQTKRPIEAVTGAYFAVGAFFRLDRIVQAARGIEIADHFDRLAVDRAFVELASSQRGLTAEVLQGGLGGEAALTAWIERRGREAKRVRASVQEIASSGLSLSKLAVAVGLLADLAQN